MSSSSLSPPGRARRARLFAAVDALLDDDLTQVYHYHYTRPFAEFFLASTTGNNTTLSTTVSESGLSVVEAVADANSFTHKSITSDGIRIGTERQFQQQQHQQKQQQHTKRIGLSEAMLLGLDAQVLRMPPLLSPRHAERPSNATATTHVTFRSSSSNNTTREYRAGDRSTNHNQNHQQHQQRQHQQEQHTHKREGRGRRTQRGSIAVGGDSRCQVRASVGAAPRTTTAAVATTLEGRAAKLSQTNKHVVQQWEQCVQVLPVPGSHVGVSLPPPLTYSAAPEPEPAT